MKNLLSDPANLRRKDAKGRFCRPRLLAVGLLLLVGAGSLLLSPPLPAEEEAADEPQAQQALGLPVETVVVTEAPVRQMLETVGTLSANESVVIATEIAGRLAEVRFAEGQRVEKGELLARLDQSVLKAQRDRARASLGLSEANYKRAELLLKEQAISERERDENLAQLRLDEADLRLAEAQLAKTEIPAPFAGILGLRQVSVGAYLQAGEPIITLDDIDPIKIDFRAPEVYSSQLKIGQTLEVKVDSAPGRIFAGRVYAIAPQIDASGRSVLLRARAPNSEGELRPGMFARVGLVLAERDRALMIPEQALVVTGDQTLVYKVVNGLVEAAPVTIGIRRLGEVEISRGLTAGDTIITAGQIKVRPGMAVTALPAEGSGPAPERGE
jgi:membrane fusion protein (multidrug efflux system)